MLTPQRVLGEGHDEGSTRRVPRSKLLRGSNDSERAKITTCDFAHSRSQITGYQGDQSRGGLDYALVFGVRRKCQNCSGAVRSEVLFDCAVQAFCQRANNF